MTNSSRSEELARLIETMRDGELSEQQHDRLQELLRDDAELRQFYVQYQLLHVDLRTMLENKSRGSTNAPKEGIVTHRRQDDGGRLRPPLRQ